MVHTTNTSLGFTLFKITVAILGRLFRLFFSSTLVRFLHFLFTLFALCKTSLYSFLVANFIFHSSVSRFLCPFQSRWSFPLVYILVVLSYTLRTPVVLISNRKIFNLFHSSRSVSRSEVRQNVVKLCVCVCLIQ